MVDWWWWWSPMALFALFAALLCPVVLVNARTLFTHRHARRHRWLGLGYLVFLGAVVLSVERREPAWLQFAVDVVFGALGCALTLSAAADFEKAHRRVDNRGRSGTLDDSATVTRAEMLEHAFYQALNLVQIVYLHALAHVDAVPLRAALCIVATMPWLVRDRFPVHSFMANYAGQPLTVTNVLYRLKKWQYVLLKHALIHGLNISLAVFYTRPVANDAGFRTYWLALNASYVFEFFLQTLVKRRMLPQRAMLAMHAPLMLFATVTAMQTLVRFVRPTPVLVSFLLNIFYRKHDLINTSAALGVALILNQVFNFHY
jgi:hypothetical protein